MNLKSLFPSVFLIAVYFIADEFFGPLVGVCTAFALGAAEFIYTRIREKVCDKMVLLTTFFFCIPGLLALGFKDSTLSRLQPALIETALCLLLGIFAFTPANLTTTLPAGYRKNLQLTAGQLRQLKKITRLLFFMLAGHTLLAYFSILFLPAETAAFISNPLLYILLGVFFAALFIRNRYFLTKMKKEEWLPLVNEKGEITGQAPRSLCHSGSKLLHPVVHLHILNEKGEIFLQKRSLKKDLLPGKWDTAVGGHIGINEKVEDALKRETFEELGISDFEAHFLGSYIWESPQEKELVFSFLCTRFNQIHIENEEVDEGKFWSSAAIQKGIQEEKLTPNFIHEYTHLVSKLPPPFQIISSSSARKKNADTDRKPPQSKSRK